MTDEMVDGAGASPPACWPRCDAPAPGPRRRMSAKRKQGAVLRLLRGEPIELLPTPRSRPRGGPGVARAGRDGGRPRWLARCLPRRRPPPHEAGFVGPRGEASLKARPADERDAEIARLEGPRASC